MDDDVDGGWWDTLKETSTLFKRDAFHIVCEKLMDEPLFKAEARKKHNQIKYDYQEERTNETDY